MRYHNYAESFLHVHVLMPATMETESLNCDKVHVHVLIVNLINIHKFVFMIL